MKKRKLSLCGLILVMIVFVFPMMMNIEVKSADDTCAEHTQYITQKIAIDNYRTTKNTDGYYTDIPTSEKGTEWIFAGWYTDATCTTPLGKDVITGTYTAKFVPAHILNVKAQVSANLLNTDEGDDSVGSLRFVTSIETLRYSKIGFQVVLQEGAAPVTSVSNLVYQKLYVVGSENNVSSYKPSDLFCSMSDYFKACTVTGIPDTAFDNKISATSFFVTKDGTIVTGATKATTVNEGIETISKQKVFVDHPTWDLSMQYEGVISLPNGGGNSESDWLYFYNQYVDMDLTLTVKDHPDSDPTNTTAPRTSIWFEFENNQNFSVSVGEATGGTIQIQNFSGTVDAQWTSYYNFDSDEKRQYQSTEGIAFRVVKEGTKLSVYVGGEFKKSIYLNDIIDNTTKAKVKIHHDDDKGVQIDMPFTVSVPSKPLIAGKYVSILGDGVSMYSGISTSAENNSTLSNAYGTWPYGTSQGATWGVTDWSLTYWGQTIEKYNMNLLVNNSCDGGYLQKTSGNMPAGYIRAEQLADNTDAGIPNGTKPDIIYMYIGHHDTVNSLSTGSYTTADAIIKDGTYDFTEAYILALERIKTLYPEAEVFCFTMAPTSDCDDTTRANRLANYNARIRSVVSDYENATLVDVAKVITTDNYKDYIVTGTSYKSMYPKLEGMNKIAEVLEQALESQFSNGIYELLLESDTQSGYNKELFYCNDKQTSGADPFVLDNTEVDGYYYMYVTSGRNFCYRSSNLMDWKSMGNALGDRYTDSNGEVPEDQKATWTDVWAPEVVYDEDTKLYYMFFSATPQEDSSVEAGNGVEEGTAKSQLMVAVSEYPYKDFTLVDFMDASSCGEENLHTYDTGKYPHYYAKYLMFDPGIYTTFAGTNGGASVGRGGYTGAIDPHPYVDDNGDKYLFWKVEVNPSRICVMKMENWLKPDWSTATVVTCSLYYTVEDWQAARADQTVETVPYEDATILCNEGPEIIKHNGKYYLTYSMNTYVDNSYQVGQAVADNIMGPYRKLTEEEGGLLLSGGIAGSQEISGTGHHSFVTVGDQMYMIYHRHDDYTTAGAARNHAIDEVKWVTVKDINGNDLDVMYVNGPTCTVQPAIEAYSEYKNIANEAVVAGSEDVSYLTDGLLSIYKYGNETFMQNIKEISISETTTFTFDFDSARTVRAIMVYNSKMEDTCFKNISRMELICEEDGQEVVYYTNNLEFSSEYYKANELDGSISYVTPGAAAYAVFEELNVKSIRVTVEVPEEQGFVGIAEVRILGK